MSVKKIAVMTSGGDAPGMNACVRAVVRTAIFNNIDAFGIFRGYEGLIDNDIKKMTLSSVGNIIQRGGTILKSARSKRFKERVFREKAFKNLQKLEVDAMVVCGGDGSYTGADIFAEEFGIKVITTPGTIDNDLFGTDFTIGYDTALNTVVQAVDKIRDTAASHDRLFFVEVMGRDAGFIALNSGIACGAEAIFIPEEKNELEIFIEQLGKGFRKGKTSSIVIVAEGEESGGAMAIAAKVQERFPDVESRVSVLGHIQRGGNPSCRDRVLASRYGFEAVNALISGETRKAVGEVNGKIVLTPLSKAIKKHPPIDKTLVEMAKILSI